MNNNFNSKNNKMVKSNNNLSIDSQIDAIYRAIEAQTNPALKLERKKKGSFNSSWETISILRKGKERKDDKVLVRYVFYASHYDSRRLGSMAIYCDDVAEMTAQLGKSPYVFGLKTRRLEVKMGARPFIDIHFALPRFF